MFTTESFANWGPMHHDHSHPHAGTSVLFCCEFHQDDSGEPCHHHVRLPVSQDSLDDFFNAVDWANMDFKHDIKLHAELLIDGGWWVEIWFQKSRLAMAIIPTRPDLFETGITRLFDEASSRIRNPYGQEST